MNKAFTYRLGPLLLAAIFFMNCMGVFLIAFAQTEFHRIAERMEHDQPECMLVLDAQQMKGVTFIGDRDFIYDGKVYDLDSFSVKNGKAVLRCSCDREETSINRTIAGGFDNNGKNIPSSMKELFKMAQSEEPVAFQFAFYHPSLECVSFSPDAQVSAGIHSLNSPPPRA